MFQTLLSSTKALRRHLDAPLAVERERYLQHCFDLGGARAALRVKSNELLWAARLLGADASRGVDAEQLQKIVARRTALHKGRTTERRFIEITRPWLKFLGWWREPTVVLAFQAELDQYCRWMSDERGFSAMTLLDWRGRVRIFLQWCNASARELARLQPRDIDQYFIEAGTERWSRISVSNTAAALRIFLRYAGSQRWCDPRLAPTIRSPRIYKQESLPFAPSWADVQRILAGSLTDKPRDVRDRAILMLLSIYGMRASEVASLRLDQLDWPHRVIRVFRLKRRQPQAYPLLPTVAEALAR
jgi:integrase/recombinase XerD